MTDIEKLQRIKDRIDAAQRKKDKAEGALESHMETLREQFGCKTVKQAEAKLAELDAQENALTEKLQQGIAKLEADYDWS